MSDSGRKGRGKNLDPDVILPVPCHLSELPDSYPELLESVKSLVRHERLKVIQSANA
ncbi:hypothetical protein [Nitrosomonas sp. Is37]|uniref:hypothetical protein n=1 Tax=Nitrosomonas sp. Is37 TaxID=3080535 RepID=UPI00294AC1EC|nr:hypothetical protein [Nitrosomonas sp. Is37]MDV6344010.1 hypothetical protein [Nitrosomonas sp. Is37]